MTNRKAGRTPENPLREIRQTVVATGTLQDPPPLPTGQLFHDGRLVDFDVEGTGFLHAYTPIEFAERKSDPDRKSGAVYYRAQFWIVTCQHCVQDTPVVPVRVDTTDGTQVYTIRASKWWMDPDQDVAMTPFGLERNSETVSHEAALRAFQELVVSSAGKEGAATRGQINQLGFSEPTPVYMIGFPAGMIEGGRKNHPVVRGGTTARIQGHLDGDTEHRTFLIDGSAFAGRSGGPIVVRKGTMKSENQALSHTVLIGIVSQAVQVETIRDGESPRGVRGEFRPRDRRDHGLGPRDQS